MKTSKPHQLFADYLGNQRVLSHPEEFLGPNWREVLNFWMYLDTLSYEQLYMARVLYCNLDVADRDLIWNAASEVTSRHISNCVYVSTPGHLGGLATLELIGAHKILEQGKELKIVQLFLEPRTNVSVPLIEVTQTASLVTSFPGETCYGVGYVGAVES